MNKRIKRSLWAGSFLLLAMVVAVGCYVFWPKPSFALPNGRRITIEAVTWRPDNRIAKTPTAGLEERINALFDRFKWPHFLDDPYVDFGAYSPGTVFLSAEDPDDLRRLEIRIESGAVQGQPLPNLGPVPGLGAGRFVFAFRMETVPQDGRPLAARILWTGTAEHPRRPIGTLALNSSIAAVPGFSTNAFWAPDPMTNGLSVSVVDLQVSLSAAPTDLLDTSLLRLKILESGASTLSTNYEIASITMQNESGDSMQQHVENRFFTNGIFSAGLRSPWVDGKSWRLRIGLTRNRNYPETNQLRLGPIVPGFGITTNAAGQIFTARIDLGGQPDPVPLATDWPVSLAIRVSGNNSAPPHHLRWVKLTDQSGTNYSCPRYGWGGDLFRYRISPETNFLDGTVVSAEAVVSWEPITFVEVLVTPIPATNYADWPKRSTPRSSEGGLENRSGSRD
jgi:hypothetical protein